MIDHMTPAQRLGRVFDSRGWLPVILLAVILILLLVIWNLSVRLHWADDAWRTAANVCEERHEHQTVRN